jgi:hypothetical protein
MDTFRRDFQLSTLGNLDRLGRLVSGGSLGAFDLFHHVKSLQDFAKDDMTSVQPRCYDGGNEEL